ncbi:NAD(P)-dependent oxidoreductase [Brachybacterium sp. ACRRE]|uniref:NAD(P)-dependent oxidoreductase n=1 Tax=Brachybacterium sp. ACRRE TaxID=2918184 RepID=UPI001EF2CF88|nr:NAD(P)H-binding protein [Brachybacterium sp. ACRRE]MCG7311444.1 NAD(P)H-binding protein [Brachybacterium sp. ACRRE]
MTSTSTGSSRIVVLGGTGYAGSLIVEEAAQRGHDVVAVSRTAPQSLPVGASHRAGDVRDAAFLADVLDGADVVIATSSPRGELAEPGVLRGAYAELARIAESNGVRLGVIGGAGSLHVSEGGPLLVDTPDFPDAFLTEARELGGVLEDLRGDTGELDWFFLSPAAGFGGYAPGERTGSYRVGGDVLVSDEKGESFISGADLAIAVADEIEEPAHRNARFTVAY